jgi:hypothetical protein
MLWADSSGRHCSHRAGCHSGTRPPRPFLERSPLCHCMQGVRNCRRRRAQLLDLPELHPHGRRSWPASRWDDNDVGSRPVLFGKDSNPSLYSHKISSHERKWTMNTMNMPGYTADASVYRTRNCYTSRRASSALRGSQGVLPQARSIGFCQADCVPGDYPCLWGCMEGGGGGGSTLPTEHCRPSCGRCLPDSDSPTGRSRLCLKANCDDYSRPC